MPTTITPTIGRKVWYWLGVQSKDNGEEPQDEAQAYDATVVFVQPDGTINVTYTNHDGEGPFISQGIVLRDFQIADHHFSEEVDFCTWMPYQMIQANKDATTKLWSEAKKEEGDHASARANAGY